MKFKYFLPLAVAAWIVPACYFGAAVWAQVAPSPQAPAVNPAPMQPPAAKHHHPRGAKSSKHHWITHEATKDPKFKHFAQAAPAQFTPAVIPTPVQLSFWGNDQFGDCVSAEEAFAKYIDPIYFSPAGQPVDMTTAIVESWAAAHGYLNGANLTDVMDSMASSGMTLNGTTYTDGPYVSVDYTNWATLTSAIAQGPVKLGIAANQLSNTNAGNANGWFGTGWTSDRNEDHCVSLCGYGTIQYLATAMGVAVPSGVDGTKNAVLMFTWDTIGIVDFASMVNTSSEAWERNPTTPQVIPPQPNPNPTPPPPNPPPPGPNPAGWSGTITVQNGVATQVNPAVAPTPPPAAWSGTITITNGIITGVAAPTFHAPAPPSTGGHRASVVIPPDWHRRQATGPAVTIHPQIRAVDVPADWDVQVADATIGRRGLDDPLPLNTALIRLEAKESRERDRRNAEWFAEKYGWKRGNFERDALTAVGAN